MLRTQACARRWPVLGNFIEKGPREVPRRLIQCLIEQPFVDIIDRVRIGTESQIRKPIP